MSDDEYKDIALLYGLATDRLSSKAAYRVQVLGETPAEAARVVGVNYHTAMHSIKDLALKYQLYLTVKENILARSKS